MQAPRYFLLLDNFFKKPDSRDLVDDLILTLLHRLRCHKLFPLHTYRYPCRRPIPLHRSYPPVPSWWCPAPAVICGKHHDFFIF